MIGFDGKVMLITGGTAGFGLSTATSAHRLGARIAIAARRADRGQAVAAELGGEALFVAADVASERDVQRLIGAVLDRWGRLDVLVNNAGMLRRKPVLEEDAAGWDAIQAVNLRGVFLCCRHALPHLIASKGAIVNVASTLAIRTTHGRTPAYDASKAGVLALTRALAVRYGPEGVRSNAVCPGFIPTELNRDAWGSWSEQDRAAFAARIPLRRLGTPEDVSGAILFLASDAAGWINGVALPVDGGVTAA